MNYRSTVFWATDINEAAHELVSGSSEFHPANRKEFLQNVAMEAVRILRDNADALDRTTDKNPSTASGGFREVDS